MSRYIKPTQSAPSELLLLYVFTINRKEKSREEPLGETKNGEGAAWENGYYAAAVCVYHKQNQREIQYNLRTEGEGGTFRPEGIPWNSMQSTVNYCELQK